MIYKRVRKNSERKLVVKWRIDYDGDNESQSIDITTTIDDENMRYNWKEWDEFKFESSKTESAETQQLARKYQKWTVYDQECSREAASPKKSKAPVQTVSLNGAS